MNSKLLASIMITGLLLSAGSVFLNHVVFADDSQAVITATQQSSAQNAVQTYTSSYPDSNMSNYQRNWSGLSNSVTTDETSRGRNIPAQEQTSAQNGVAVFDTIHVNPLANLASNGYQGLNNTTTDEQGRDRNSMIDNARASSLATAEGALSQLVPVQQNYANFQTSTPTDESATYDRQTRINQSMQESEAQAAGLVSQLAKINGAYINLGPYVNSNIPFTYQPGSVTNELNNGGRNWTPQEISSLDKALQIFNEIHQTHLAALKSSYAGLSSVSTDESGRDRNQMIADAQQSSLDNALRVYNSYYNGVGLK